MPRPARPGAHDDLLEAARAEFARRGLDRARVEDIARRARISKGAFYLHFRTKQDAFAELLQRFLGALEEHARRRHDAEERFAREHGGGAPDLARFLEFECALDKELLDVLWRNRHMIAALDGAAGKLYARLVGDFRRRMRSLIANRILDKQRAGRLRPDVDPEVIGDIVVGTYEDFARRMADMTERPDLAAWVRSFLVVLYEGILERPSPRRARPGAAAPRS
jgi:AcrR family transcriptional regulator